MLQTPEGRISVIIPARNATRTIARCLRSLAGERELLREIILVDDGSSDGTATVAADAARQWRLPLTCVAVDAGSAGAARNAGLARASADLIHFLDADDELLAGALFRLARALDGDPDAGLVVGATIRRAGRKKDLLKVPHSYGPDRIANVRRYLRNELWPIAMGSALARRAAIAAIRFPVTATLDEDTAFWASVMRGCGVAMVGEPVLLYHLDDERMNDRFLASPATALANVDHALNAMAGHDIPQDIIGWRKAWVARRFARQLILAGRYSEAREFVGRAASEPEFSRSWKLFQYRLRIVAGEAGILRGPRPAREIVRVSTRKTFLLVTHDPVWPPVSGYELRNWQIARSLARLGDVTILSVRPPLSAATDVPGIQLAHLDSGAGRGEALASGRASIEPRLTKGHVRALNDRAAALRPDAILFAGVPLARLLSGFKGDTRAALIMDMHNVESDLIAQLSTASSIAGRLKSARDKSRVRRLERRAMAAATQVWCCSAEDRDRLYRMFGDGPDIRVIANGVPVARWDELALPDGGVLDAPTVLFAGHLGYAPNVGAAQRLAGTIMPLIRNAIPAARLRLAGRSPAPAVVVLGSGTGAISVVANPPEMEPLYRAADLAIVPLAAGGGTRIKILEAMAFGVPVVATAIAAEGLNLASGADFIEAQTDNELAEAAVSLLADPARSHAMRARAFVRVWASYGADATDDMTGEALARLGLA